MTENTDQQLISREFSLNSIAIIGADGVSVDISQISMELILRQDIFTNYMSGELMVVDGIGLIHERKAHGNEYLTIDVYEPGGLKYKKIFRIFKISNRETTTSNAERYIIHFVSDEMVHSNLKRISKAYKKTTIDSIVEDIFVNYMGIGKYTIEKTGKQVDIVIPSWRPTQALNWLSRRAENGNDKFCYLFYENLDGFHFESLHSIYKTKPLNKINYIYEPKAAQADMELNRTTIDNYKATDFDILSAYSRGATSMRYLGLDPVHRKVTNNEIPLSDIPRIHDRSLIDNVVDPGTDELFYEQYDATRLVHLQTEATATEQANESNLWIRHIPVLAMLTHSLYHLTMPGNLQIQIGKMVNVIFPNFTTGLQIPDGEYPVDIQYLVTSVTHIFNIPMGTFDTSFVVTRDSVGDSFSIDSSLPTKVRDTNEK